MRPNVVALLLSQNLLGFTTVVTAVRASRAPLGEDGDV